MLNIALIACGLLLLFLSALVLYSNSKAKANRALSGFLFSAFLWLFANLLANMANSSQDIITYSKLTLVGATMLAPFYLFFCYYFTHHLRKFKRNQFILFSIIPLFFLISTPTSLNIKALASNGKGILVGPAYYLLVPYLVGYFGYGTYLLVHAFKKVDTVQKMQLRYIFVGICLTFIPGIILNGILPLLGHTDAASFGPLSVIFIGVFTAVAIIRHKLLDIRLIVARSLGYILSLGVLAFTYGAVTYLLTTKLSLITREQTIYQALNISLLVIAAISYSSVKSFFDKSTNHIFYRDAYDPQVFLDTLNSVMVSNIELEKLLASVVEVISANMKATFCMFSIRETSYFPRRVIGDGHTSVNLEDTEKININAPHLHKKVIETDDLEEGSELRRVLIKNDITILVRLVSTLDYEVEGIGYIMFGPKKSGNPYSKADLRILDIVANELVIAVQNGLRFEEIEKFNATLQAKIDDATHKLQRTNEKLKQLDETKDEFISMASHQLRTPLTSVKGYLSMTLEGDAGKLNDMQKKLLGQAFISSQRMVYLIADLLNVSRLKTGKFIIEAIPSNLAEVVEGEVSQLIDTAKGRELVLSYKKPPKFPTLMLDETKIRQVVMNFTDNAIYYTPAGGHITLELVDKKDAVEFTVSDNGIGVPAAEQHHLFSKFYRAVNAQKARPDGTGLGLFMAQKVIVAQGGSIIFHSKEGKGSTFGFSFPKDKLLPPVITPVK